MVPSVYVACMVARSLPRYWVGTVNESVVPVASDTVGASLVTSR